MSGPEKLTQTSGGGDMYSEGVADRWGKTVFLLPTPYRIRDSFLSLFNIILIMRQKTRLFIGVSAFHPVRSPIIGRSELMRGKT